ncbi:MAG: PsbP-related protein [Actinomycetota bacterium]
MASEEEGRELSLRRKGLILGATVIVAIGLVGAGVLVGKFFLANTKDSPPPASLSTSPEPTTSAPSPVVTPSEVPSDFTRFNDRQAGFSIAYPKTWDKIDAADPQVRLVAAGPKGESMLVRAIRVGFDVKVEELDSVKTLTDKIVRSGEGVEILAGPTEIESGGIPGYFYFYSFKDEASGEQGAHSHYFLFEGRKMISIVFQVIPLEDFPAAAPVFDQIAASFQS